MQNDVSPYRSRVSRDAQPASSSRTFVLGLCYGLLVLCATSASVARAQTLNFPAASFMVSPTEQAQRDRARLQILHDELAQETRSTQEQVKRKAERLIAHDTKGAQEADLAIQTHSQNQLILRREIELTMNPVSRGDKRARTNAPARAVPASPSTTTDINAPNSAASVAPWWDVYARAARTPIAPPENPLVEPTRPSAPRIPTLSIGTPGITPPR